MLTPANMRFLANSVFDPVNSMIRTLEFNNLFSHHWVPPLYFMSNE